MKKAICIFVSIAMVLLSAACSNQAAAPAPAPAEAPAAAAPSDSGGGASEPVMKVAFVVHAANSSFFSKMMEGAQDAGKDLNVQVDVKSPQTANDVTEQTNIIESCIQAKYDAIATTAPDPAFKKVLQDAADAGIPVIIFNSDDPDAQRAAFVGQDLEDSGYQLGKYFYDKVLSGKGNVLIGTCSPDNNALILRMNGMRRAALEFPEINVYDEPLNYTPDMSKANGLIEAAITAHPDLNGILSTDVYTDAIGTVVNAKGLKGKIFVGGFDLTENTLQMIKDDVVQVTIGQNPYLQGYYPIVQFYLQKTQGFAPVDIATGAFLVDKSNVDNVNPE